MVSAPQTPGSAEDVYSAFIKASYKYSRVPIARLRPVDRLRLVENLIYDKTGIFRSMRHLIPHLQKAPRSISPESSTNSGCSPVCPQTQRPATADAAVEPCPGLTVSVVLTGSASNPASKLSSACLAMVPSMSRRRLALNLPTLEDQVTLPPIPSFSILIKGSESDCSPHAPTCSPLTAVPLSLRRPDTSPVTPLDQILRTPVNPPILLRQLRRNYIVDTLGIQHLGDSLNTPSSPFGPLSAGFYFTSPQTESVAEHRDTYHHQSSSSSVQKPGYVVQPIVSPSLVPRRLFYFQASGKLSPAPETSSSSYRSNPVLEARPVVLDEPLHSPLIVESLRASSASSSSSQFKSGFF